MASYNTFVVVDCKTKNIVLVTSSARKATKLLDKGIRIDVWCNNVKTCSAHNKTKKCMEPFIQSEKTYIQQKQKTAEIRNKARKRMCSLNV